MGTQEGSIDEYILGVSPVSRRLHVVHGGCGPSVFMYFEVCDSHLVEMLLLTALFHGSVHYFRDRVHLLVFRFVIIYHQN